MRMVRGLSLPMRVKVSPSCRAVEGTVDGWVTVTMKPLVGEAVMAPPCDCPRMWPGLLLGVVGGVLFYCGEFGVEPPLGPGEPLSGGV